MTSIPSERLSTETEDRETELATETETSCLLKFTDFLKKHSTCGAATGYCISFALWRLSNQGMFISFPYFKARAALQYLMTAVTILFLRQVKVLENDKLDISTMRRIFPVVLFAYLKLFLLRELVYHGDIFYATVPIVVTIAESILLKKPWPSVSVWFSLAIIFAGGVPSFASSNTLDLRDYLAGFALLLSMSAEFVYAKHIIMKIELSTWGFVLCYSFGELLLLLLEMLILPEVRHSEGPFKWKYLADLLKKEATFPFVISCFFALSMLFFRYSTLKAISATGYAVLNITNRLQIASMYVIALHFPITDLSASGLLLWLLGGALYLLASAENSAAATHQQPAPDEEMGLLLQFTDANRPKTETTLPTSPASRF